jgi:predicted TIM-barrel fold metal-dependent hydrolase
MGPSEIDYPMIDADNHYYEPADFCTRHIESRYRDKAIRYEMVDGDRCMVVGDRVASQHVMRTRVPIPGHLAKWLKSLKQTGGGGIDGGIEVDQPMQPEYQDRDARLAVMDRQAVQASLMIPTYGLSIENQMRDDVEQTYANLRAFNRWLEDDWGFAHKDRIFGLPLLSLLDLDLAIGELERVLARGARCIHLTPGPQNRKSPAHPLFDPFWARVNEAGIRLVMHSGDAGYNALWSEMWGEEPAPHPLRQTAWQWFNTWIDRPLMETITSFIYHNFFDRFPQIKLMSVENGSNWAFYLMANIDKKAGMAHQGPWPMGRMKRRPSTVFKEHVYITPFMEDDIPALVDLIGPERVMLGSDFPHSEGLAEPRDFAGYLPKHLDHSQVRDIMRDTCGRLLGVLPTRG